jgi:hypothetical protein
MQDGSLPQPTEKCRQTASGAAKAGAGAIGLQAESTWCFISLFQRMIIRKAGRPGRRKGRLFKIKR